MLLFFPPNCRCTTLLCSPADSVLILQAGTSTPCCLFPSLKLPHAISLLQLPKAATLSLCFTDCFYSFECTWNLLHLELWMFSLFLKMRKMASSLQPVPYPAWEGGISCWVVRQWNLEACSWNWSWGDPFPLSREKPKYFASMWLENLHFGYVCTNIIAPEEWYGFHSGQ